ncbi:MAG: hypothetical protein M3414_04320 [Pseudomonadota bacterium]|nr:hypothetical protein [Pseudomonadota bacterium]
MTTTSGKAEAMDAEPVTSAKGSTAASTEPVCISETAALVAEDWGSLAQAVMDIARDSVRSSGAVSVVFMSYLAMKRPCFRRDESVEMGRKCMFEFAG